MSEVHDGVVTRSGARTGVERPPKEEAIEAFQSVPPSEADGELRPDIDDEGVDDARVRLLLTTAPSASRPSCCSALDALRGPAVTLDADTSMLQESDSELEQSHVCKSTSYEA